MSTRKQKKQDKKVKARGQRAKNQRLTGGHQLRVKNSGYIKKTMIEHFDVLRRASFSTSADLKETIEHVIGMSINIGLIVESVSSVAAIDERITITEEQQKLFDKFDELSVRLSEDATAILGLMSINTPPSELPTELCIDLAYAAEELTEVVGKEIVASIAVEDRKIVNAYMAEHSSGIDPNTYATKTAYDRLMRVTPKYRTKEVSEKEFLGEDIPTTETQDTEPKEPIDQNQSGEENV